MSSSTGSSPTISNSVPHSSQETISPLSVSISTWTSASHSGQVPVGTVYSSNAFFKMAVVRPVPRESPLPCLGKLGQSTRRGRNLQHSFSLDFVNVKLDQLLTNYCQRSPG